MLQVRKGHPPAVAVPLGGGAVAMVRPATAFEYDLAVARAGKLLAGLIESQESATLALEGLGQEFAGADFTSEEWLNAAAQRTALLELATLCVTSWTGVVDETGAAIEPSREILALVLRGNQAARAIRLAIEADVNVELAEGNASATSPNGGEVAALNSALTVEQSAQPAAEA
jgi:hypothetical protein